MVPDDSLFKIPMFYYHLSVILRAVQLDLFLDVLSGKVREWKSYSLMKQHRRVKWIFEDNLPQPVAFDSIHEQSPLSFDDKFMQPDLSCDSMP